MGFTLILMKGKTNILSEVNLLIMIYDLSMCVFICVLKNFKKQFKCIKKLLIYMFYSFQFNWNDLGEEKNIIFLSNNRF